MMVHKIKNATLLVEFDIHKYFMAQSDRDWKLLKKFFLNHILELFGIKVRFLFV